RRTSVAQIAVERISQIDRPALGDHRACDVWASDRTARRLLENRGELDAYSELVQAYDDALGARATHVAKRHETRLERPRIGQVQAEDVRLNIVLDGTQLDARHHANAELGTGRQGFADPIEGVVIGERDRAQSNTLGLEHDITRRARAVG